MELYIENLGRYEQCTGGETLVHVAGRLAGELGFDPICALVNNKNESLLYPVYGPKKIKFLPIDSPSGERVYVRTLCMILYNAVRHIVPCARLSIEHSISRGYYCRLNGADVTATLVARLKQHMTDTIARDIKLERHEKLTSHVKDIFSQEGLDDKTLLLDTIHAVYTAYYTLQGTSDSYYGALASHTGIIKGFDLIPYKDGMLLLPFDPHDHSTARRPTMQEKMYTAFTEHLLFNKVIGVKNVGELNRTVLQGHTADLINVAEALHAKKISSIADEITARYHNGGARIVLIAGPSSSGKTTTTKRLATFLMTNLLRPQMISLDDYFVNRDVTPRDESGEYDYESIHALDIAQFNRDLNDLLNGKTVELPSYDFESGTRTYKGNKLHLDNNSILLIEGIHGLNPELTAAIDESMKFRVYVSALTTLSIDDHNWVPTTDNRLLRRIIRDHKYRGTSAVDTLRRWASVRRGEERWIFPYQENADAMFNSSLIFELGVMKEYGEKLLADVPHDIPEYAEAHRLVKFLSYFQPIGERLIPPTSLLREFLGGSSFHY